MTETLSPPLDEKTTPRVVEFLRSGDASEPHPAFMARVPEEAQARLKDAFPDLRFVWNAKRGLFQCVCRETGWRQTLYTATGIGLLTGWRLIPGSWNERELRSPDEIIAQLRAREYACTVMVKARGCADVTDMAEKIADEWIAKEEAWHDAEYDQLLGLRSDGTVNPFGLASPAVISRPYARGPGAKEQARREKRRMDRALREGAPS